MPNTITNEIPDHHHHGYGAEPRSITDGEDDEIYNGDDCEDSVREVSRHHHGRHLEENEHTQDNRPRNGTGPIPGDIL